MKARGPLLALALLAGGACHQAPTSAPGPLRVVSLAPATTETLFAIGAGANVVGRSQYCDYPPEAARPDIREVGTMYGYSTRALIAAHPSLIVGTSIQSHPETALRAYAPTEALPWTTLDEVLQSIRRLGQLTGHTTEAEALATRIDQRLQTPLPQDAPRVLLVVGENPSFTQGISFIRRNSLTGVALRAAGARNAVDEDVNGLPMLDATRIVEVNPDTILVLLNQDVVSASVRDAYIAYFRQLRPVRAAQLNRIGVVACAYCQTTGPRIVNVVDALAASLRALPSRT